MQIQTTQSSTNNTASTITGTGTGTGSRSSGTTRHDIMMIQNEGMGKRQTHERKYQLSVKYHFGVRSLTIIGNKSTSYCTSEYFTLFGLPINEGSYCGNYYYLFLGIETIRITINISYKCLVDYRTNV